MPGPQTVGSGFLHPTLPGDALTSVRLISAAALPACTYSAGAKTLTGDANGALSIDGVAVDPADVVIVKNQATTKNNGVYTVTTVGDGSNPFVLTRHASYDTTAELLAANAALFLATAGTANAGYVFALGFSGTMDTDPVTFTSQWLADTHYLAGPFDIRGFMRGSIRVPSAWTAARIAFRAAEKVSRNGDYVPTTAVIVRKADHTVVAISSIDTSAAGWYEIPEEVFSHSWVYLVSMATGSEANAYQAAARSLVINLKSAR